MGAVLAEPGHPLDQPERRFFERRFGQDLGAVRVHDDARAAGSARSLSAAAYAVGRHVILDLPRERARTPLGMHVLAHELMHTIQNRMAEPETHVVPAPADAPEERTARTSALSMRRTGSVPPVADGQRLFRMTRDEALAYGQSMETRYPKWLQGLPDCPCTFAAAEASPVWKHSVWHDLTLPFFHPGASKQVRSAKGYPTVLGSNHGQQCCYDAAGRLITEGPGAGTPDVWSAVMNYSEHQKYDVETFKQLGWRVYDQYWIPNKGVNCPPNAGGGTRIGSGRFRIVGPFKELSFFLFSVVTRDVTAAENVQVVATGRDITGLVGGRGHYSEVEVLPTNEAARRLFGGDGPRYVPSYLLQPL